LYSLIYIFGSMEELNVNERILKTASRLFYNQGYNLTGTNQIIAEANIAKASLYTHYPSKTDLLKAYLHQKTISFFDGLNKRLHESITAKDKLFAIFIYHRELYEAGSKNGCPFLNIKAEVPPTETDILNMIKSYKMRVRSLIHLLVDEIMGYSSSENDDLSDGIYFLLEGSAINAPVTGDATETDRALKIVKRMISK
jgi:AcrR family transcriptional regulator